MDNKQLLKISLCFLCENACDLLQVFFPSRVIIDTRFLQKSLIIDV